MSKYKKLYHLLDSSFNQFTKTPAFDDPLGRSITYEECWNAVKACKSFFLNEGIFEYDKILIFAPKSLDSVTALLGVIQAKGVYIPVDHYSPLERLKKIILDCKPKGIVCDYSVINDISQIIHDFDILDIPESSLKYLKIDIYQTSNKEEIDDLAYILYTSGSTGIPKGVLITHQNSLSFIDWASKHFNFTDKDVFSSIAPFHFDLSIFDLFVAVLHGATVVLFNESTIRNPMLLSALIEKKGITVWYSTPTVLILIMKYGKPHRSNHESIKTVLYAGEVFPIKELLLIKNQWSKASFYNLYGPTETNVCTWEEIPDEIDENYDTSIIGQVCSNSKAKILDENNQLIDINKASRGELVISGNNVTHGYLNLPELNTNRFLSESSQTTWYRTGDIVEAIHENQLSFVGRKDRMIKRRGYRVELGEIETAISKYPTIQRVGVLAIDHEDTLLIKVYIQAKTEINLADLKTHTSKHLPSFMMPDQWIVLDELPITSTHKIDYQQLKLES